MTAPVQIGTIEHNGETLLVFQAVITPGLENIFRACGGCIGRTSGTTCKIMPECGSISTDGRVFARSAEECIADRVALRLTQKR